MNGCGRHGLEAGKVDRSLPVLHREVAVHTEVLAHALYYLKVDVIQRYAVGSDVGGGLFDCAGLPGAIRCCSDGAYPSLTALFLTTGPIAE